MFGKIKIGHHRNQLAEKEFLNFGCKLGHRCDSFMTLPLEFFWIRPCVYPISCFTYRFND